MAEKKLDQVDSKIIPMWWDSVGIGSDGKRMIDLEKDVGRPQFVSSTPLTAAFHGRAKTHICS